MMRNLVIGGGIVVTMDSDRRIIDGGTVHVRNGRIAAIAGPNEAISTTESAEIIDASGMLVLPGLIDAHAHAGHALVKTLGSDDGETWFNACRQIYTLGSDEDF